MRIGRKPTGPMDMIVRRQAQPYIIYEEMGDTDGWNGKASLQSTNTTVEIATHNQSLSPQQYPTGEQTEGSMQGLVTTDDHVDVIDDGYCIVHSGTIYEMTVNGVPTDDDPDIYAITFEPRSDLQPP